MFTSFSTALSALSAHATAVDVVGNNLSNLNTPGFKTSVVSFHDLVTQSLGAGLGETQVGFGVGRPVTIRQFSQGAIQTSPGQLDAAIQGDGFLVVKDNTGATLYTRGGNLQVDKDGSLLTSTGERLQGWTETNGIVNTSGPTGDIVVPVGTVRAPVATRTFSFDMNLNAAAPQNDTFQSSIEVFDSLGAAHVATVTFTKTGTPNQWDYAIEFPLSDVSAASDITGDLTGTIEFDSDGRLIDPAAVDGSGNPAPMPQITIDNLTSGASQMQLTWNLYDGTRPRFTQFAQPNAISANAQDGNAAAQLIRVGLADGGKVLAQYSNGRQTVVGQLAMASIRNPESLIAVGNNNYQLSARTALPAIGLPATGGRGTIIGGAVEYSTVDIAREFTQLIVLQRGYQANAKVITAVDELSQETINLKR
ncbi:MAG TPA: flagellar hook protein FlgE [Bryobacteraceae bacterium]|nr:flagellar hook protein FlgE [Bryobacteraceae bacterium]